MASVFQITYTKPSPDGNGRIRRRTKKFWLEFRDSRGVIRRVPGTRDKRATEAMAAKFEREAAMGAAFGYAAEQVDRSIEDHVQGYDAFLQAKGVTDGWRKESVARLRVLITKTGARRLVDISMIAVARVLRDLEEGRSKRTRNAYLRSLRAFVAWAIADRRLAPEARPLDPVRLRDERNDPARPRRSIAPGELARLMAAALRRPLLTVGPRVTPERRLTLELRGRERALVYSCLFLTGLRVGELAGLRWRDVRFVESPAPILASLPSVVVESRVTGIATVQGKSRKTEQVPLVPWLVEQLVAWRRLRPGGPGDRIFKIPSQFVRVLRRDLAEAGIAYRDAEGKYLDVHSIRHSTATFLAVAGVAPRVAQAAMRHKNIDLTMNTYVDMALLDVGKALATLPISDLPALGGGS